MFKNVHSDYIETRRRKIDIKKRPILYVECIDYDLNKIARSLVE